MLCDAVERADNGQIDADLGGGVIKQRMARIGSGKSKGYRSIILRVLGTFFHMLITILFISFSTKKGDRFIFKTICFYNFIRERLGTFFHMLITILLLSFSTKKRDKFIFQNNLLL